MVAKTFCCMALTLTGSFRLVHCRRSDPHCEFAIATTSDTLERSTGETAGETASDLEHPSDLAYTFSRLFAAILRDLLILLRSQTP